MTRVPLPRHRQTPAPPRQSSRRRNSRPRAATRRANRRPPLRTTRHAGKRSLSNSNSVDQAEFAARPRRVTAGLPTWLSDEKATSRGLIGVRRSHRASVSPSLPEKNRVLPANRAGGCAVPPRCAWAGHRVGDPGYPSGSPSSLLRGFIFRSTRPPGVGGEGGAAAGGLDLTARPPSATCELRLQLPRLRRCAPAPQRRRCRAWAPGSSESRRHAPSSGSGVVEKRIQPVISRCDGSKSHDSAHSM